MNFCRVCFPLMYCCSVCIHSCCINLPAFRSFPALSPLTPDSLSSSPSVSLYLSRSHSLPPFAAAFTLFSIHLSPSFPSPISSRSTLFHPWSLSLVLLSFFHLPPSVHPSCLSLPPSVSPCFPRIFSFLVSFCSSLGRTAASCGPILPSVSPSFSRVERRERAHFPRPQSHFALRLRLRPGEKRGNFASQPATHTSLNLDSGKKVVVRSPGPFTTGHME